MTTILFSICFLFILSIKLGLDVFLIEVKKINLTLSYKFTLSCILLFLWSLNSCYYDIVNYEVLPYFILIGFQASWHWFLFDLTLNILRDKPFFYNGVNSVLDLALLKIPNFIEFIIKFSLILFFTRLYIINFI